MTPNVLQRNRLTGSLASFEEGEEIFDKFFVGDGFACGIPPTVLAPTGTPLRQRCVDCIRGQDLAGGERRKIGLCTFYRILRVRANDKGVCALWNRLKNACYGLRCVM